MSTTTWFCLAGSAFVGGAGRSLVLLRLGSTGAMVPRIHEEKPGASGGRSSRNEGCRYRKAEFEKSHRS